jgi:hypothetical protein
MSKDPAHQPNSNVHQLLCSSKNHLNKKAYIYSQPIEGIKGPAEKVTLGGVEDDP